MKKIEKTWSRNGYTLRLSKAEDVESYYTQNFQPLDPEVVYLTGSKKSYTHEEVVRFFLQCIKDPNRYDFLILSKDGQIVGESVLNEIDWDTRCANYRIILFHEAERGLGIGTWVTERIRDFAFEELNLHRLELDVFSFNPCAEKAYSKAGFIREGVRREAIWNGKEYADDILMALLNPKESFDNH